VDVAGEIAHDRRGWRTRRRATRAGRPPPTAITVVSLWTSRPTYLFFVFMCWSLSWVVGFTTAPLRLGSLSGSNPRLRGQAHFFSPLLHTQL
jgi:hypothetical protein